MAEVIKMPKMSDTMEEGVIASWLKKEGDEVKSGDILAEVETDKATMELESYEDGVLLHIGVQEKESVPVDAVIAILGEKGEDISDLIKEIESGSGSSSNGEEKDEKEEEKKDDSSFKESIDTSNINASVITMPKMSDTMEEGTIASWLKKVGDDVSSGDILAEVETDKATMELESYEDGKLLYIGVEEGAAVAVDGIIAVIGEAGADYETLVKAHESGGSGDSSGEEKEQKKEPEERSESSKPEKTEQKDSVPQMQSASSNGSADGGRVKASPLAKKMAEDKGYDINQIQGSGDNGRIIKRDVENFTPQAQPQAQPSESKSDSGAPSYQIPQVVGEESFEEVNVSQMRKVIAKRLAESKFSAPHFYLTMEINMDKAIEARKSMNELSPVKISFNDIVIKAVAAALRQHPGVNSSWLGDKIRTNEHI
ncbi:MAG: biotin/lipoyl-containing protein, partial [Bacteroidota bacterium]